MIPVIHVLCWHVFSKLFGGSPGVTAMHTNLMYSAAYDLSTNRLTPNLFNPCSNDESTPTPIFQRKHLNVTLSTYAQLLRMTYPRPLLSGPRSFKMLDDLSHSALALFQGVGNLLVALAIFMLRNNMSFKILRDFFAMWCHVGTFSDQYESVWELHYKFEHTYSLCTWAQ